MNRRETKAQMKRDHSFVKAKAKELWDHVTGNGLHAEILAREILEEVIDMDIKAAKKSGLI